MHINAIMKNCLSLYFFRHLLTLSLLLCATVYADVEKQLPLSEIERAWLKEHPVIRVAADIAWPPFEWVDSQQQYQGIAADYLRLVEKKLGIRLVVEKDKPWAEVVTAVKEHRLDMFSCVAKNPLRQQYVNFTKPYLSFPMVIVTTQDVSYIDGINGLKDSNVSVVKDYATHEYMATEHPQIKLLLVATSEEGLEAVSQGKVDAFVDNIATVTNIIQSSGLTNLKISGEMPIRYELGMAVRNDWPLFVDILQKALDTISDEQRRQIHNKWIGVRYEHGVDYGLFWKTLVMFLLIVLFLYIYNRKLSKEIRQRKSAEQAAMLARDEADKANQTKSEFLSVVSHELRTPLTSIKGALGLLKGGATEKSPEQHAKMLQIAYDNSERLELLVNDILDIEKLLAGKLVFKREQIFIRALLEKAVAANQGYASQYQVSFSVDCKQCDNQFIIADESRIMQVMSNLLSNAIKYSPTGACVDITAHCTDSKVRISVRDHGEGIPVAFYQHIFSHFSQADSTDTREKGGTGLGLAISREIIERQGGQIGFTSTPGEGASFFFELDNGSVKTR